MSHRDEIHAVVEEFARGRLGRRDFIRRAAALGLSTAAVAMVLEACSSGGTPTATTAPGAASAPPVSTTGGTAVPTTSGSSGSPAAATAKPAAKGGQAVISLGEPDSLFAGSSRTALSGTTYSFIANGLTKLVPPSMDVEKDLAESWTTSPDGKTYTFTLRKGVKWQDGEPFTVQDVKFTFEYLNHPDWPGALGPNYAIIEGADAYKKKQATEITGIKALDDTPVQFTLTEPNGLFLAAGARTYLLPQHLLKGVSPANAAKDPFARKPVYTGPFMVEEWKTGEGLTFKAFPDHFAGRPNLDRIVGRNIPDQATLVAEVRAGGVQMSTVTADQFGDFEKNSAYHTQQVPGSTGWFLVFDLTNPLFADTRVRQAMSHAIDRAAIIKSLLRDKAEPNFSFASPLSWIYNPNVPKFDSNIERAKQLLDEVGWKPGADGVRARDGRRFAFKMMVFSEDAQNWALAIQPLFKTVGIQIQIDRLDLAIFISKLVVGQYEGALSSWANGIVDPRSDLQLNLGTPRVPDATGNKNDQVDQLLKQANASSDRNEQKKLYGQVLQIAEGDAAYVYLWRPQTLLVVSNNLVVPEVKAIAELYARAPSWGLPS